MTNFSENPQTQEIVPMDTFQQPLSEMETDSRVLSILEKLQQCITAFNYIVSMAVDDHAVKEIVSDINVRRSEFKILIEETSQYARSASIYTQEVQALLELVASGYTVSDMKDFVDGLQDLIDEANEHHDTSARFQKGFCKLTSDLKNCKERLEKRSNEIEQEIVTTTEDLKATKRKIFQKLALAGVAFTAATVLFVQCGLFVAQAEAANMDAEFWSSVAKDAGIIGWLTGKTAKATALATTASGIAASASEGAIITGAGTSTSSYLVARFFGEAMNLSQKGKDLERQRSTLKDVNDQIDELTKEVLMANEIIRGFDNFWEQMVGYLVVVKRNYDKMKETGQVRGWNLKAVIRRWNDIEINYALYANNVGKIMDGMQVFETSNIDSGSKLLLNSS